MNKLDQLLIDGESLQVNNKKQINYLKKYNKF